MSSVSWQNAVLRHAAEHHGCPRERVRILECDWNGGTVLAEVCGEYWLFDEVGGRGDYEFSDYQRLRRAPP